MLLEQDMRSFKMYDILIDIDMIMMREHLQSFVATIHTVIVCDRNFTTSDVNNTFQIGKYISHCEYTNIILWYLIL